MKRSRFDNAKGMTLIELIITMAIFGMVIMVAYPMLSFTIRTSDAQLKESKQRNEIRVVSSYLKNDIEYSKDLTVINSSTLQVVNNKGETIQYNVQLDADGNSFLVRQNGGAIEFKEILNVEFQVLNNHLIEARLITDIAENKYTDFKIFRWSMLIQKPDTKEDIHEFITKNKVFVLGNQVVVQGGSTVSGPDATTILRNNLNISGSSLQAITTKNIYVDGNVTLDKGAGIGKTDNSSSIYITGNCTVTGTGSLYGNTIIDGLLTVSSPKLRGNIYVDGNIKVLGGSYNDFINMPVQLYYTGNLFLPKFFGTINAAKVASVQDIVFPDITLPPLQKADWYAEKGYTSTTASKSGMRYYGGSFTFEYNNGNTFNDVIIVSKQNITISGDKHVTGILFAPNGDVLIDKGSTFEGLIIAKKTSVSGNSHVTFQTANIEDLPF